MSSCQARPLTLKAIWVPAAFSTTTSSASLTARTTFFVKAAISEKSIADQPLHHVPGDAGHHADAAVLRALRDHEAAERLLREPAFEHVDRDRGAADELLELPRSAP